MSTRGRSRSISGFQDFSPNSGAQSWPDDSASMSSNGLPLSTNATSVSESTVETSMPSDAKPSLQYCPSSPYAPLGRDISDQAQMSIPETIKFDSKTRSLLTEASREPPVTTKTLSELDLGSIMNNIHLRSDVNFDNDLHFMPIKGERGDDKRKKARDYWIALAAELRIHEHMAEGDRMCTKAITYDWTFTQRLPMMFSTLKELLVSLVPDRDHLSIMRHLDVAFIMQQISKGVLDITGLAKWLASLLKCHCAPMRDEITDYMVVLIERGLQEHNMKIVASGLEQLFAVLEAMKLDVANHQIRTFRLLLIDDTEQFQRDYFERLIQDCKFDPLLSGKWYASSLRHLPRYSIDAKFKSVRGMIPLIIGLSNNITAFRMPEAYPMTFCHDARRLSQLRHDIQDLIHLHACFHIFNLTISDRTRGRLYSAPNPAYASLQARIFAILGSSYRSAEDDSKTLWKNNIANIALEIVRAANILCDHESRGSPGPNAFERPMISDDQVQVTCLRLVEAMKNEERHQSIADPIKLGLFRSTARHALFFNTMGSRGISEEQRMWTSQSSIQLGDSIHPGRIPSRTLCLPTTDLEDISRRLAHIVVLNWRVWATLCYVPYCGEDYEKIYKPEEDSV